VKHRQQTFYIIGALLLLAVLYFGFDTRPSSQKALEKSRALTTQEFDIPSLQAEARKTLSKSDIDYLETLEAQVQMAGEDSTKIRILKQLSGFWFKLKNPLVSGLYAQQIAEKENTGESWSIAGTTFSAALQQELESKQKVFARDQALDAFEKAISLEPNVIDHRVNQALCYIEVPQEDQPMKGIQMLAGLASTYPESAAPPYQLARLAVKTGQYERAQIRIEQALKLEPKDSRIACLAIEIYTALNKPAEAGKLAEVCAGKK
jgi:tetratricopeptide (TPR) repeat protein